MVSIPDNGASMKFHSLIAVLVSATLAACAGVPVNHDGPDAPRAATIVPVRAERPVVALALGSGGARGFAHVGVIKALEAGGIVPDIVVGASSGAIVAALYAGGLKAGELEDLAVNIDKNSLVDFVLFGSGWVRGEALQDFVNGALGNRTIEQLPRRFAVAATRSRDRAQVTFNRGNTGLAVRASASVPNLFIAPVIRGEEYIDGGLTSPVPVAAARAMGADVVIAVDVSWMGQARLNGGGDYERAQRRPRLALLDQELARADVVITPALARTRLLDFDSKLENIAAGELAGRDALAAIRERIAGVAQAKRQRVADAAAAAAE